MISVCDLLVYTFRVLCLPVCDLSKSLSYRDEYCTSRCIISDYQSYISNVQHETTGGRYIQGGMLLGVSGVVIRTVLKHDCVARNEMLFSLTWAFFWVFQYFK